ncbi:hypothetical protein CK203_083789 [Vitis vinifera]|uniref:Uncharacterized protein n=1 Tax=Vitis vinifera TaxID=29760 RepID=A0A438DLN3_VITVI|nr:hypothetical protein CK203_083789 [Vitis vinifera]
MSGEVRGDDVARAGPRVEELANARLKAPLRSADGTSGQASGAGCEVIENRAQVGLVTRLFIDPSEAGPSSSALAVGILGSKRAGGSSSQGPSMREKLKGAAAVGAGPAIRPLLSKDKGWLLLRAPVEVNLEEAAIGNPTFNDRPCTSGRSFEGEYYDHSGVLREDIHEGSTLRMLDADRSAKNGNGCWDLVEVNCVDNKARNTEWGSAQSVPPRSQGREGD